MELTAHGITRVGPAKVSGRHLSEAANEPFTEEQLLAGDLARNLSKAQPDYHRSLELQQQRLGAVL